MHLILFITYTTVSTNMSLKQKHFAHKNQSTPPSGYYSLLPNDSAITKPLHIILIFIIITHTFILTLIIIITLIYTKCSRWARTSEHSHSSVPNSCNSKLQWHERRILQKTWTQTSNDSSLDNTKN